MSKVDSSQGGNADYETWRLAQPPTASDGADVYIEKLLAQSGLAPSSVNKDKFEKAGVASAQTNKTFADQALKWASIIFAGALGVVGLRYVLGSGATKAAAEATSKAAETAAKAS